MKIPNDKLPFKSYENFGQIIDKNDHLICSTEEIEDEKYLVNSANNFPKALEILKTIKLDAEMALDGRWDRSDGGFQCQIDIVNEFLNKLGNE